MTIDRNDTDERQARLDTMIQEFQAAQQRQLVKRESLRNRAGAAQRVGASRVLLPPVETHH